MEETIDRVFQELTPVLVPAVPPSPGSVVRSIVTTCLQEMSLAQVQTNVVKRRVRPERRFGEEITTASFLEEMKKKKTKTISKETKSRRRRKNEVR